jgi:hypothetical protein
MSSNRKFRPASTVQSVGTNESGRLAGR